MKMTSPEDANTSVRFEMMRDDLIDLILENREFITVEAITPFGVVMRNAIILIAMADDLSTKDTTSMLNDTTNIVNKYITRVKDIDEIKMVRPER